LISSSYSRRLLIETAFGSVKSIVAGEPVRIVAPPLKLQGGAVEVLGGARELDVFEIARSIGMSKAATHRLLAMFARSGFMTRNAVAAQHARGPRLRRCRHIAAVAEFAMIERRLPALLGGNLQPATGTSVRNERG
jgi:hypothetical protein